MKKNKFSSLADKPYLVWSILFIIAPLLMVAYYALTDKSGAFSLASVEQIPTYITTILLSVLYGVAATAICLVLGFPFAYIFSKAPQKYKNIVVLLVMLEFSYQNLQLDDNIGRFRCNQHNFKCARLKAIKAH